MRKVCVVYSMKGELIVMAANQGIGKGLECWKREVAR